MNRSVELNSTFTMTCIESGDRPLQINWTKNGVDLGNRNNNTYTVDHVTFDHAGLYGCTAINWAGKTHTMFWIDVTGKVLTSCQSTNRFNDTFGSVVQNWYTFQSSEGINRL